MDSSLHMHVAKLKIQDDIRRASAVRLANQAEQASRADATRAGAPRGYRVALRRVSLPSLRRVH